MININKIDKTLIKTNYKIKFMLMLFCFFVQNIQWDFNNKV